MATTFQAPLNGWFLLSEATGERSRAKGTIGQTTQTLPPGTLLSGGGTIDVPAPYVLAATEASITAILLYWADSTAAAVEAPLIKRDAEVNEAYLIYDALDREKVADQLATFGIVVRRGVLAAPSHTFGVSPATDPALAKSVYGPMGHTALAPGGIYTAAASVPPPPETEPPPGAATLPEPANAPSQPAQQTDRPRPPAP